MHKISGSIKSKAQKDHHITLSYPVNEEEFLGNFVVGLSHPVKFPYPIKIPYLVKFPYSVKSPHPVKASGRKYEYFF